MIEAMEKNEQVYRTKKRMLLDNFLGGISWSLGVWVGTTVVIALLVFLLSKIDLIPVIGSFVAEITKYVAKTNSPFNF